MSAIFAICDSSNGSNILRRTSGKVVLCLTMMIRVGLRVAGILIERTR
jgi:hypothetical protein